MSSVRLSPRTEARFRAADFTYPETGHTSTAFPTSYRTLQRSRDLMDQAFEAAAEDLMRWRIHARAGLKVFASGDVAPDTVVVLRLGLAILGGARRGTRSSALLTIRHGPHTPSRRRHVRVVTIRTMVAARTTKTMSASRATRDATVTKVLRGQSGIDGRRL